MDSEERFQEEELPPRSAFYNKLTDSHISEVDYQHAQNVWRTFDLTNMGEYSDLYVKTDVLLLADVFENFRDVCFDNYHLDPAHYFTSPGLAWDAMLKKTGVKLELLDDIDMVNMIQKGIRGGVSMISKKYAKANNPHVPDYNSNEKKTWITYLDMNNLYGTAMCERLPERGFRWLNERELKELDVMDIPDDSEVGYILEVSLDYPSQLHDLHSEYPLAPETLTVDNDMLSPYTTELKTRLHLKGKPVPKLVPNLYNKSKYVIHYRNLKQYLQYGLVLQDIHRAICFQQSNWLETYISFNTARRKEAQNDFQKDFFKLMNNAVFGMYNSLTFFYD